MSDEKPVGIHSVDTEVASETNQFDAMSAIPEDQKAGYQKISVQLMRARQLARVYMNSKNGPQSMLEEIFIQMKMQTSKGVVFENILRDKYGMTDRELVEALADQIEKLLDSEQMLNGIIITPDGVYKD